MSSLSSFNFPNRDEGESFLRGQGFNVRGYGGVYGKDKIFRLGVLDVGGTFHYDMIPRKPVKEDRERLTKALESYIPDTSAAADASPSV